MVYRLVHMVYAMVVAPAAANVFFALQLLEPVTRLLIAASRGVEVTPDKLTRRYSEVPPVLVNDSQPDHDCQERQASEAVASPDVCLTLSAMSKGCR